VRPTLLDQKKNPRHAGIILLVQGEGFEPPKAEPDDLQSPVFDRFTNPADMYYGADDRDRTCDPRFTKPLLYQLSYIGMYL